MQREKSQSNSIIPKVRIVLIVGLYFLMMPHVGFSQVDMTDVRGGIEAIPKFPEIYELKVYLTDKNGLDLLKDPDYVGKIRIVPDVWMGEDGFIDYFNHENGSDSFSAYCDNDNIVTVSSPKGLILDAANFHLDDSNGPYQVQIESSKVGVVILSLEILSNDQKLALDSCVIQVMPLRKVNNTWYVDRNHEWPYQNGSKMAPFTRIQDAINAADANDTIMIAHGEYTEHLVINKAGLKLRKKEEDEVTLDGMNRGRVIDVNVAGVNEGEPVQIEGFVIKGGKATDVNDGDGGGGAVLCRNGNVALSACIIRDNTAINGGGIAIYSGCDVTFSGCTIYRNQADWDGGGIYAFGDCSVTIQSCEIIENDANNFGGGLYGHANIFGTPQNTGDSVCTRFKGNSAKHGGAIYFNTGTGSQEMKNCIFSGNFANTSGAAVGVNNIATLNIYQCTFTGNRLAEDEPNGLALEIKKDSNAKIEMRNSILWNEEGLEISSPYNMGDSSLDVKYCDIKGISALVSDFVLLGLIDQDPVFRLSGYWNNDLWIDGNYRLKRNSPCIDAGDPAIKADSDADDGRINLGAYAGTNEASSRNE